jgi:hypothetical protein
MNKIIKLLKAIKAKIDKINKVKNSGKEKTNKPPLTEGYMRNMQKCLNKINSSSEVSLGHPPPHPPQVSIPPGDE